MELSRSCSLSLMMTMLKSSSPNVAWIGCCCRCVRNLPYRSMWPEYFIAEKSVSYMIMVTQLERLHEKRKCRLTNHHPSAPSKPATALRVPANPNCPISSVAVLNPTFTFASTRISAPLSDIKDIALWGLRVSVCHHRYFFWFFVN